MRRFTETINPGTKWEGKRAVKGVTLIHLFNEVWRIGKFKIIDNKFHSVIYSPEDKEYHVWGDDVISFYPNYETGDYGRSYTKPDPAKVKIYILTSIMDDRANWCFDLKTKPEVGKNVKIIYDNGTIQIKKFSGEWTPITIDHNIHIDYVKDPDIKMKKEVKPVCFRIK